MNEVHEVTLRLLVNRHTGQKMLRVGTHRPGGAWVWVCDWICGEYVHEKAVAEAVQVADDLWYSMVGHTVGIATALF